MKPNAKGSTPLGLDLIAPAPPPELFEGQCKLVFQTSGLGFAPMEGKTPNGGPPDAIMTPAMDEGTTPQPAEGLGFQTPIDTP